jgi:hypothetical protein
MSAGKCNHQPDEGDTALLWDVHNYQLTWYYVPEDWSPFRHDYENCVSRKLVLALIFMSEFVILHKLIKEIFLKIISIHASRFNVVIPSVVCIIIITWSVPKTPSLLMVVFFNCLLLLHVYRLFCLC